MEAIIPRQYVRVFVKMIQTLGKIGEDISFLIDEQLVLISAINKSRSVYAGFKLAPIFFENYTTKGVLPPCKIKASPCLAIFRTDQNVERVHLKFDALESRVSFNFDCKFGVRKHFRVTFEETEDMVARFSTELPNMIISRPRLLLDAVTNFHPHVEEVTLVATEKDFRLRSHIPDETSANPSKLLHSEMIIDPNDFERYNVDRLHGAITFTVKELKALLAYAEQTSQLITIHIDQPGVPIVFSMTMLDVLRADFVIASLSAPDSLSSPNTTTTSFSKTIPSHYSNPDSASSTPSSTPSSHHTSSLRNIYPSTTTSTTLSSNITHPSSSSSSSSSSSPTTISSSSIASVCSSFPYTPCSQHTHTPCSCSSMDHFSSTSLATSPTSSQNSQFDNNNNNNNNNDNNHTPMSSYDSLYSGSTQFPLGYQDISVVSSKKRSNITDSLPQSSSPEHRNPSKRPFQPDPPLSTRLFVNLDKNSRI